MAPQEVPVASGDAGAEWQPLELHSARARRFSEEARKTHPLKPSGDPASLYPIGSMVLLYMVTWIPSIYPSHVSIYTSTMDPMGIVIVSLEIREIYKLWISVKIF